MRISSSPLRAKRKRRAGKLHKSLILLLCLPKDPRILEEGQLRFENGTSHDSCQETG